MNITIITLSLTMGGAERVICNMCNDYLIKNEENNVTIISLMKAEPEYELDDRVSVRFIDDNTAQYMQNPILRMNRRTRKLYRMLTAMGMTNRSTISNKQSVIISFLPEPNLIICGLKNRINCPVIISVRNDPVKEYGSFARKLLMKSRYLKADGYVFQTKRAKEYFAFNEHIVKTSTVIPNPLAREFLDDKSKADNSGSLGLKQHRIIAVGRLEKQKNPVMLLEAFAEIHNRFPEYELVYYGEGSLREELENRIEELGLGRCVSLPGACSDMKRVYLESEIYVLASNYEGMPNALMEAMAMGMPCIATDCPCGGPEFLIRNGENGILITVGNKQELIDALTRLIKDKTLPYKMGIRARQIRDVLEPDRIYSKWMEYIEMVMYEKNRDCNK